MWRGSGMSLSNARRQPQGLRRTSRRGQRRLFGRFFGTLALLGFFLLAGLPVAAQAATDGLFAAPLSGRCRRLQLAGQRVLDRDRGYERKCGARRRQRADRACERYLPAVLADPDRPPHHVCGPEPHAGTRERHPDLDGTNTVSLLSVGATSNVTIDGLEIENGHTAGQGGGISNSGTLTVENSTFSSNAGSTRRDRRPCRWHAHGSELDVFQQQHHGWRWWRDHRQRDNYGPALGDSQQFRADQRRWDQRPGVWGGDGRELDARGQHPGSLGGATSNLGRLPLRPRRSSATPAPAVRQSPPETRT